MAGIKQHSGLVVLFDAANVDTDAIIPKQFLRHYPCRLVNTFSTNGVI